MLRSFLAFQGRLSSPSLRGSGLKSAQHLDAKTPKQSPSLRGSGLKLSANQHRKIGALSPSLRGSGLK